MTRTHAFELHTFHKPAFCALCHQMLWGLARQGVRCRTCGLRAHKRCAAGIDGGTCSGIKADGTLRRRSSATHVSQMVSELLCATQAEARQLDHERRETRPALNVLTRTPRNMARFVARVGPLADAQDWTVDVVTWRRPARTCAVLVVFVLLCLNPYLILLAPQAVVTALALRFFWARARFAGGRRLAPVAGDPAWDRRRRDVALYRRNMQWIQNFMGMHSDMYDAVASLAPLVDWRDVALTWRVLRIAWASAFAAALLFYLVPPRLVLLVVGSAGLVANAPPVRALRRTGPGLVEKLWREHGQAAVRQTIAVCVAARRLAVTVLQAALEWRPQTSNVPVVANTPAAAALDSVAAARNQPFERVQVRLFENQRQRADTGAWGPETLPFERHAWSDHSGAVPLPDPRRFALRLLPLPATSKDMFRGGEWSWEDHSWRASTAWRRQELGLGDTEAAAAADSHGWVYSDAQWKNEAAQPAPALVTRRRCWVRRAIRFTGHQAAPVESALRHRHSHSSLRTELTSGAPAACDCGRAVSMEREE